MATDVRNARRRKILDRGSDRLALIMGRIQTLPSSASSHDENTSCTGSDPPSQTVIPNDQDLQPHISHQTTIPSGDYEASGSSLLKRDPITISGEINAYDGGSNLSPLLHKYETSIEGSRASASEVSGEVVKLPTVSPIDQSSPASTLGLKLNLEQQTQRRRLFTLNQISSAIAATEGTRLLCSAIIAILVMLSYLGFPLLGSYIIKSIISFRPLYLVLLTNATIVLTRLTFDKQRDFEWAARDESETPLNGYGWAEQLTKSLEMGLVMQKAFDAVFMDCSVYEITVICGLSLSQPSFA